ncbi:hypothetical protein WICMUC_005969 [Wickerhamomyces mucosus]|uniref:S-adenosylmethionine-dependent methyltransferase n=1 Tax=Wickerhamomyces mucosus TaxID=1378264 RepID=A0A9P8P081_9ASCO|nr:hypothetical protein WICMUC_005969 [Wickerhamomyces mucosus]
MENFDPLSFFTPDKATEDEIFLEVVPKVIQKLKYEDTFETTNLQKGRNTLDAKGYKDDNSEGVLHILDFPNLNNSLPENVVLVLLKLLAPTEETNFNSVEPTDFTKESILDYKQIAPEDFDETESWLFKHGYLKLSKNLISLKFSSTLFQYLNKILAISTNDEIIRLTSLRISENSGRTAKPNFKRKIVLKGLTNPIYLNEPALTSDNLGLKTWGSSLILAELIVPNHSKLLNPPILELGSGTGLTGIAVGLLGHQIILTDLPEITPNLQINVELNALSSAKVDVKVLDWTDPSSFIKDKGNMKYNTIIIADPIYSSDHPNYVVNMLVKFLNRDKDARILLQIPIRPTFENEREKLWKLLKIHGFKITDERILNGFDDFGKMEFIYKRIEWDI